jgi:diguanylate cyclase (GGDEF)-like protein
MDATQLLEGDGFGAMSLKTKEAKKSIKDTGASSAGIPEELWPVLVKIVLESQDYVVLLDESWRILKANDAFRRDIVPVGPDRSQGLSFLALISEGSAQEVEELKSQQKLDGGTIELIHPWQGGGRSVQYFFRCHRSGWVALGRDQSTQLELVKQLAVMVDSLETRVDSEKERAKTLSLLAEKDHLTGLANRRYFERILASFEQRFRQAGLGFSLISIDVDQFKQVNDTHGHAVGDQVLKVVAGVLEESIREGDCAARYGGDEFVVLLKGVELPTAVEVAERLRQMVEKKDMPPSVPRVTISLGVSSTKPGESGREGDLLELADQALYVAKKGGRNRFSFSGGSVIGE